MVGYFIQWMAQFVCYEVKLSCIYFLILRGGGQPVLLTLQSSKACVVYVEDIQHSRGGHCIHPLSVSGLYCF